MSSKLSMPMRSLAGTFSLPNVKCEQFLKYEPGSPERKELMDAQTKAKSEVLEVPVVIDGKEYFTGNVIQQRCPGNHKHVLANIHIADEKQIQHAIETCNKRRKEWASMPQNHRSMIFSRAGDLLATKYRARVNAITMLTTAKTVWQAEIDAAAEQADFLRQSGKYAEQIYELQPPINDSYVWNRLKYREQDGFIAAISPFNFCSIGTNLVVAPAIVGNVVLWKPATTAVLENYICYKIQIEAGLPNGVVNFQPSKPSDFSQVFNHPSLAGIHFTGSTEVFNTIWKNVGNNISNYKNYPRLVGETGGKNFHVIHPDCGDLDNIIYQTIHAAFEYQGQKCSACSRLYVPKSVWIDQGMRDKLVKLTKEQKQGPPEDLENFMSAVIDKKSYTTILDAIEESKKNKETSILVGGTGDDSIGYYVHPTIIETKDPQSITMKKELFGPVLTVYVFDDTKEDWSWVETLEMVESAVEYGLTGSVFARRREDIIVAEDILTQACGNFYINDKCTGAIVGQQPFGGSRKSGTNDKAGSIFNLLRWVSPQTVKERTIGITTYVHPHMLK